MTKQIRRTWPALVAAAALSGARAQAGVLFYEGFQYSSHAVPGTAVEESDRRDAALAFGHYWILNGSLRYKKVSPLMTSGNMAGIPSGGLLALSFTNEFDKGGVARVLWLSFLIRAGAQDNDTERSNYLHLMDSRMKALDVNVYTDEDAWRPREYLEGFFTAGGLAVGSKPIQPT